jgi:hypothetical protein
VSERELGEHGRPESTSGTLVPVQPYGLTAIFRRRVPLALLSLAALLAALSWFANGLISFPGSSFKWTRVLLELKASSILWAGVWLLLATVVLTSIQRTRSDQRGETTKYRDFRHFVPLGVGLALIWFGALLAAVGLFASRENPLAVLQAVAFLSALLGGAVIALTVFAMAARTVFDGPLRVERRLPPWLIATIGVVIVAAIMLCALAFALEQPRASHRPALTPIESLLVILIAGALVAGTVYLLVMHDRRRTGTERAPLASSWFILAAGFALVVSIVPNALLTDQPLLGAGPPSLTTAYAAFAASLGIIGMTLFVAAARRPNVPIALRAAASGFVVSMLGTAATAALLQLEVSPRSTVPESAMFAAVMTTGVGFLIVALAVGHWAIHAPPPAAQRHDGLWVGSLAIDVP